jgi:hypothetical protein
MTGGDHVGNDHYDCEVNRDELSMSWLKDSLNDRWNDGWKLAQVFEQAGNTVVIWERRT